MKIPLNDVSAGGRLSDDEVEVCRAAACLVRQGGIWSYGALMITQLRLIYNDLTHGHVLTIAYSQRARELVAKEQLAQMVFINSVRTGRASENALLPATAIFESTDGGVAEFGIGAQCLPAVNRGREHFQFIAFAQRVLVDTDRGNSNRR